MMEFAYAYQDNVAGINRQRRLVDAQQDGTEEPLSTAMIVWEYTLMFIAVTFSGFLLVCTVIICIKASLAPLETALVVVVIMIAVAFGIACPGLAELFFRCFLW